MLSLITENSIKETVVRVTDRDLIEQVKDGDHQAFEELVKRYEARVAATVFGMLGHCQTAEDVGQEVFIRLFKYIKSFRDDASLATYLTRIAINLCLTELNRRKRRLLIFGGSDDEVERVHIDPDDTIERAEDKKLVHDALQELDPDFRAVAVLRLIEGYSTRETAEMLDLPLGTVLSRLSRAQKKLKNLLAPYIEEKV